MIFLIFACFSTNVPPQEEGKIPEIIGEASDEYGSTSGGVGGDSSGGTSGGDSSGGDSSGGTSGGDSSGGTSGGNSGGNSGGTTSGSSSGGSTGGENVSDICEETYPIEMLIPEDTCYTEMISCGDVIDATTSTGTNYYDGDLYISWHNNPKMEAYNGQEHAFYFYHPGSLDYDLTRVEITLETPCSDMDILYFLTPDSSPSCYTELNQLQNYSNGASANNGIQSETLIIDDNNPNLYFIIVESRNGQPNAFRLTVDCFL